MYRNFFTPDQYSDKEIRLIGKLLLFDADLYRSRNPDLDADTDALLHFVKQGMYEGRAPFNIAEIADNHNHIRSNLFGEVMDICELLGFDQAFYSKQYPDLQEANAATLQHFLAHGMQERRQPFNFLDHLEAEKITWSTLKKFTPIDGDSLDRQMLVQIDGPAELVQRLIEAAQRAHLKPKTYRNNFWMVLAIGLTAMGYYGAATLCYNYFYNYMLPMPQLGNWKESCYVSARISYTTDYVVRQGWIHRQLETEAQIVVPDPIFLNRPNSNYEETQVAMPPVHYCQLHDVILFGLNAAILADSHDVLYDYQDPASDERPSEIKAPNILHWINKNACSFSYVHSNHEVPEAFSLLHDHSHNYFHLVV